MEQVFKVLIVDDDRIALAVHRMLFQRLGHDVSIASNGEEAVTLAEAQAFDVILMDVNMPIMDGIEATRVIRNQPNPSKEACIVGITAFDREKHDICLAAGMNVILSKPVKQEKLIELIQTGAFLDS